MLSLFLIVLIGVIGTLATAGLKQSTRDFAIVFLSFLLITAWNWTLIARLPHIIKNDTINHLSATNGILLLLITTTLTVCCIYMSVLKTRYLKCTFIRSGSKQFRLWLLFATGDFLFTFVAFSLALAAVPQLFYLYYQLIIPGLPVQWVLAPIDFKQALHLLAIHKAEVLSTLSAGLLIGSLLVSICWSWLLTRPFLERLGLSSKALDKLTKHSSS